MKVNEVLFELVSPSNAVEFELQCTLNATLSFDVFVTSSIISVEVIALVVTLLICVIESQLTDRPVYDELSVVT